MVAPVVIVAIIVLIVALLAIMSYTAWLNTHNEACINNLTKILRDTENIRTLPDQASTWCSGVKEGINKFEDQCPAFSIPTYESYIPPCK